MLIGTYRHQLDAKNRFRVPTKLKAELGTNFIITKGTGGCLFAFSSEGFEDLYKKVSMLPLFDEEAQKPVRKFLSSAFETEEDGQSRILLPKELKDKIGFLAEDAIAAKNKNTKLFRMLGVYGGALLCVIIY